jgi:hypothetical protein
VEPLGSIFHGNRRRLSFKVVSDGFRSVRKTVGMHSKKQSKFTGDGEMTMRGGGTVFRRGEDAGL